MNGIGISLGYLDESGIEFGLGSGPLTVPIRNGENVPGNMTRNDTGQLGSGTKPYTATAIMKLAEQGKLSLDDPAHKYVDISLQKAHNTTMEGLFGPWANRVTVGDLIYMRSGIQDFEVGSLDSDLLKPDVSGQVHDPFNLLLYVSQLPEEPGCKN